MRRLVAYIRRSCMSVCPQLFSNFSKTFWIFQKLFDFLKFFLKFWKTFWKIQKTFWKIQKLFWKIQKTFWKIQKILFEKFKNFFENSKSFLKFPKHVFLRFRAGTNYLRYAQDWGTSHMEYEKPVLRSLKRNTLLWRYLIHGIRLKNYH